MPNPPKKAKERHHLWRTYCGPHSLTTPNILLFSHGDCACGGFGLVWVISSVVFKDETELRDIKGWCFQMLPALIFLKHSLLLEPGVHQLNWAGWLATRMVPPASALQHWHHNTCCYTAPLYEPGDHTQVPRLELEAPHQLSHFPNRQKKKKKWKLKTKPFQENLRDHIHNLSIKAILLFQTKNTKTKLNTRII